MNCQWAFLIWIVRSQLNLSIAVWTLNFIVRDFAWIFLWSVCLFFVKTCISHLNLKPSTLAHLYLPISAKEFSLVLVECQFWVFASEQMCIVQLWNVKNKIFADVRILPKYFCICAFLFPLLLLLCYFLLIKYLPEWSKI